MKKLVLFLLLSGLILFTSVKKVNDDFIDTTVGVSKSLEVESKTKLEEQVFKTISLDLKEKNILSLNGEVDEESAKKLIKEIKDKEKNKELYLLINSPGGSVFHGSYILRAMQNSKAKINTVCMSLCASMAFVIHQQGEIRMAQDKAILMSHPASSGGSNPGQLENQHNFMVLIKSFIDKMEMSIAKRNNMTLEEYKALVAYELWLDAEDATKRKFNDKIVFINNDNYSSATNSEESRKNKKTNKKSDGIQDIIWKY